MEAVGEWGGLDTSNTRLLGDVQTGYTFFREGDVLVAKITPCFENGKGALAGGLLDGFGFGTTELHVISPSAAVDSRFLFYVTISHPFRLLGQGEMFGAGGQKRVPESFLLDFPIGLPAVPEQRAISSFLDRKTGAIDALIAKKERLIELLQEKRQALITQAVTKGLDPNVPMKDSGVEWLGRIPSHWEFCRLKQISRRVVVGIAQAATHAYCDDGVPIIRSTNLRANRIDLDELLHIDRLFADELRSKYIYPGDLLTVRTGNAGVTAVVPDALPKYQCFTMLITTLRPGHVPQFFSYLLNSDLGATYFDMESWGTAQANISVPILQNAPVFVPPAREQREILAFLGTALLAMDRLLDRTLRQIETVREYRQALITAAVTGKIDVSNEAA